MPYLRREEGLPGTRSEQGTEQSISHVHLVYHLPHGVPHFRNIRFLFGGSIKVSKKQIKVLGEFSISQREVWTLDKVARPYL